MNLAQVHKLSRASQLSLLAIVILLGGVFFTVNNALQEQNQAGHASGGTNLIINPSFESGKSPWVLYNFYNGYGTFSVTNSTAEDGANSAVVNVTSANSSNSWYVQLLHANLPMQSGQTYTVSFWAKASANRPIEAVVQQSASPYAVYAYKYYNITTSWEPYSFTFTPNTSQLDVSVEFNLAQATGQVWIDNVSYSTGITSAPTPTNTPTPTLSATGTNFLTNPGCESGTNAFYGWQASISTVNSPVFSGNASCKVESTGGYSYDIGSTYTYPNPQVGQTFSGAAFVRAASNTGGKVYVALREGGGSSPSRTTYGSPVSLTTNWQLVTNTMTVQSSGRTEADYYVVQDPGSTAQVFYVDNMYFGAGSLPNISGPSPTQILPSPTVVSVPTAPTGLTATAGDGQVTLNWDAMAGDTYNVYVEDVTANTSATKLPGPVTTNTFTVTPLINGHAYIFTVSANNSNGVEGAVSRVTAFLSPTATATISPTAVPQPTNSPVPGHTVLNLNVGLQGIGTAGDSSTNTLYDCTGTNPPSNCDGNMNPLRPTRAVKVDIYDSQNQLVMNEQQGTITYNPSTGKFTGTIDLGSNFTTGFYSIKIKADQYLRSLIPGIQNINSGQANQLPYVSLVAGDISGDNAVNIVDYNILIGCWSDLLPPTDPTCTTGSVNNVLSDLNDDGHVNQFDYVLFLRELTNIGGQ